MDQLDGYLVSLVIPVYNVEAYLEDCLDSVAAQTIFDRTQVILVDDGSTDDSPKICSRFANQYENVTLVTQENAGLGAARNTGIQTALSEFIAFLDSDDVLPRDSLSLRVGAMTSAVDVVVGDMQTFPRRSSWVWSRGVRARRRIIAGVAQFPALLNNASACNKLFRTSFFKNHPFPEGVHFEDGFVIVPALLGSAAIAIIPNTVYMYRKRATADSIMDNIFTRPQNYWDHLQLAATVLSYSSKLSGPRVEVALGFVIRSIEGFLLRAPEFMDSSDLERYFDAATDLFRKLEPSVIRKYSRDLSHRLAFVAILLGEFPLFRDRWSLPLTLEVVDGEDRLHVPGKNSYVVSELLKLSRPQAHVEYVEASADGTRCILGGRLTLPGVPASGLVDSVSIQLVTRGAKFGQASAVSIRTAAESSSARNTVLEWQVDVESSSFRTGKSLIDVRVGTGKGSFSVRLRPSLGFLRGTRTLALDGAMVKFVPSGETRVALTSRRGSGWRLRLSWTLHRLKSDYRSLRDHDPFASLMVIRWIVQLFTFGKPVWLIGERGDTAQDNGFALFEWLRKNAPDVRARYVLSRDSKAWRRVDDRNGIVARNGWRHVLSILQARVLISSQDIDAYLLPQQWKRADYRLHLSHRLEHRRVFLQHGVIYNGVGPRVARGVTGLDLFVCSSPYEYQYLLSVTGYRSQLCLSGMPRFDTLNVPTERTRIVFAPTWRHYLVAPSYESGVSDPGTFETSFYREFIVRLLSDERLLEVARSNSLTLTLLPHYELAGQLAHVLPEDSPIEVVSDPGPDFQRILRSAKVLITDYSSIMFDAVYAGIPVVQCPFDYSRFYSGHYSEGWLEVTSGRYWPVATTVEGTVDAIISALSSPGESSRRVEASSEDLFEYHDEMSSKRIYDRIVQLS